MTTTTTKQRLFSTKNDLSDTTRAKLIDVLNQTLASILDLRYQVKQAHWNVKGLNFFELHTLFDELATELDRYVDEVAERATTLGGVAHGTVRDASQTSILPEYPTDVVAGVDHLHVLIDRYALFGKHLRQNIDKTEEWGDKDTADLYTEISRLVDMRLWFLESHIQE